MVKPLIAANWKMNKTIGEAVSFTREMVGQVGSMDDREIVLAPSFASLSAVAEACRSSAIRVAAQNMHWEEKGACTGEVSPLMVLDAGCAFVIIGHSERRRLFGERDEDVNRKIRAASKHHLNPIFCLGESLEERESGSTFDVVAKQLEGGLNDISSHDIRALTVAYEPVWAIGTGKTATPVQADEVHAFIRKWLVGRYGESAASSVRIIYGGSVNEKNVGELMAMPGIQGALVGGASLEVRSFLKIVRFGNNG